MTTDILSAAGGAIATAGGGYTLGAGVRLLFMLLQSLFKSRQEQKQLEHEREMRRDDLIRQREESHEKTLLESQGVRDFNRQRRVGFFIFGKWCGYESSITENNSRHSSMLSLRGMLALPIVWTLCIIAVLCIIAPDVPILAQDFTGPVSRTEFFGFWSKETPAPRTVWVTSGSVAYSLVAFGFIILGSVFGPAGERYFKRK